MRARALPFLAGAVLVLVPGVASAQSPAAPVQNAIGQSGIAQAEVVLPDGRAATIWVARYDANGQDGWGELYLEVACESRSTCLEGGSGTAELAPEQIVFSGSLRQASVTGVDVTLYSWDDRLSQNQVQRQVTVSARLEGTGQVSRAVAHGDQCPVMGATCQSVTLDASRSATASLTLDGETGTGSGSLSSGRYLSVGAPR